MVEHVVISAGNNLGLVALSAGIAFAAAALATAIAEKSIGTAAVGAVAENQDNFSKVLILTVIPETIVIFGLVIAILILGKV